MGSLKELAVEAAPQTTAVLVVEDDAMTARLIQKEMASVPFNVYTAGSLEQAQVILRDKNIALMILDLILPDGDGRNLLAAMRQKPAWASIPILILSAKSDPDTKAECFSLGADAYFEKPLEPSVIAKVAKAKLERLRQLRQESALDPVTHLPNRIIFQSAFARASRVSRRTRKPLTLAILDLDRFKSVNDLAGHQMGDRVLERTASILLQTLRASDLLARWGGEEFAVLFTETNLTQARAALNKALSLLRQQTFVSADKRQFKMTFSAGVAQVEEGMTLDQAMAEADRYLYLAKAAGRNHVLSKEDRLDNLKRNILLVEDDAFTASLIRRFLEKEGFHIFHARDGKSALSLSSQASFSLITLDVRLPDMDGFDLLARFRQTPMLRNVPVIMLTAAREEDHVLRGFRLGADDYIVKPFSPSQVLARVNRFLEK